MTTYVKFHTGQRREVSTITMLLGTLPRRYAGSGVVREEVPS